MKFGHIKCVFVLLVGLFISVQALAQDSKKESSKGGEPVASAANLAKATVKVDSAQDSLLILTPYLLPKKVAAVKKQKTQAKPDSTVESLLIQTSKSTKGDESVEDKIAELSEFLSGNNVLYTIVFLLIGFTIVRVSTFILNALAERSTHYRIMFKGLVPIVKIVSWSIVLTLIVVVIFEPSLSTMLAFSASIGVAVGFASQDILKNVFGGIVILLDRPFVSGDKIEVDKYYGEVVEIGLRSTRIVTPDDSLVTVPNAVVMNSSLSNANAGEPNCQVTAEIYLPITIDTIEVREIATQAATVSKYIYLAKPISVSFANEINASHSFYKMKVRAYVMDIRNEFAFKSDMTELVIKELVNEGVIDGNFVKVQ